MFPRIWRALLKAASVRQWSMILAAPALTAVVAWIIHIIQRDGWSASVETLRIHVLANIGYGALALVGLVVVALTGTQVVASVGKTGVNIDVQSDDDEPKTFAVSGEVTAIPEAKP